ncbi:MAG: hypothetical protein ACFCGT_01780 [Sandaracinaceae bacterium]
MLSPPWATVWALAGLTMASCASPGPRATSALEGQVRRGLYVAGTDDRLAADGGASILRTAGVLGAEEVALYGLGPLLASEAGRRTVRSFVARARRVGLRVAAPIAGLDRVRALAAYAAEAPEHAFDTWITELEYWHDCRATQGERPCFASMAALLEAMAEAVRARPVRPVLAAYVGYPTPEEAEAIAARVDRLLLSYDGASPREAWTARHGRHGSQRERLLSVLDLGLELWPILYVRGERPMAGWLRAHTVEEAEAYFSAGARRLDASFAGFQYFDAAGVEDLLAPDREASPAGSGRE